MREYYFCSKRSIEKWTSKKLWMSTKGYIPGNIQWIDKEFSNMKMNRDERRFFELCKEVVNYQSQKTKERADGIPQ